MKNKIFNFLFISLSFVLKEIFPIVKNQTKINFKDILSSTNNIFFPILPLPYKNPYVRKAIWLLKYKGQSDIAYLFCSILSEEILNVISDLRVWCGYSSIIVIPLPNSIQRRKERGWNQTELVLNNLCNFISLHDIQIKINILYKTHNTISQTKLSRHQRLQNPIDCFTVRERSLLSGKIIILFDDVITTGATINEASKTLYNAGALKVIPLCLAH